mmetsp:Transcript_49736/g.155649  ORF Transcript_49736/g.155649 Transcript_49736/m.155649 type:complete len:697 (+) Transcript_49736:72-2162(+)
MAGGKRGGQKKKAGGASVAASDGKDHLKVCGPASVQTLRGQLLGREVALVCCGELHEDAIDLTREKCVVDAEEGWVRLRADDGMGFDPEEVMATQEGLTLPSAKTWAERIITSRRDDSDSEEEEVCGFLVFVKESTGPKARGTGYLFRADAQRSPEHELPASAVVLEWDDLDDVAREFNKRRLARERIPFTEQDAIIAERKQLRRAEGIELFDDWLLRQATDADVPVEIVVEASVPVWEVEFHTEPSAGAMPPSPDCIRQLEPDSDADSEDEDDPADGTGTFLDYLYRRLVAQLPQRQVRCIDPRDLGDPQDEAEAGSFQSLLPEPLPADPDDLELNALGVPPRDDDARDNGCGRSAPSGPPLPSWEAYFSAAAELLYYSPQIKADFAPFLSRCVRNPAALRRFFEALYFRTVPEAVAAIGLNRDLLPFSRIRSPVLQPLGGEGELQRRRVELHKVPVSAAPLDRYIKAKGFDPPRTWVSGLAERLRAAGAGEIVDAAKGWFRDAVEYLLSDPKEADEEGDYFLAWLRTCHRDIHDDIDRSDPAELRRLQWAPSSSHPRSKKHRHKLEDISIPDVEEAFQELSRFDPTTRVSTGRERVLAKIILDCIQLRMVDLAAILRVTDAVLAAEPGSNVVVIVYAGVDHTKSVADFLRARGFGHAGLPQQGYTGKEDWGDEPRALTFPAYLHDFSMLFPPRN